MLKAKYQMIIKNNKYIKELEKVIRKQKNESFTNEIDCIVNNEKIGCNVLKDINQIFVDNVNEKFSYIVKKIEIILQNRNFKRITILVVICTIILSTNSVAYAAEEDITAFTSSAEFLQVQHFIKYLTMAIRAFVTSVCGLIAAQAGLRLVTEENTDGAREAKKSFQKILWALFLVFAGTAIASLIARRLLIGM